MHIMRFPVSQVVFSRMPVAWAALFRPSDGPEFVQARPFSWWVCFFRFQHETNGHCNDSLNV